MNEINTGRAYMGVRFQGKIYRFSVFNLPVLLEKLGGYLPTNFYHYHIDFYDRQSKHTQIYRSFEALNHGDGNSLGAFPHEFVIDPTLKDDEGHTWKLIDGRWEKQQ